MLPAHENINLKVTFNEEKYRIISQESTGSTLQKKVFVNDHGQILLLSQLLSAGNRNSL